MGTLVPQVAYTDTFKKLIDTVNLVANITSNSAITVGSNTTGDTGVTGNFYSYAVNTTILNVSNIATINVFSSSIGTVNSYISVGNSTVNAVVNSTSFSLYNANVNFTVNAPTPAQVTNGQYFLNANGTFSTVAFAAYPITNASIMTTGTTSQIIDSWPMSSYNTAEYLLAVIDNNANNFYSSSLRVLHNTNTAFSTEINQMTSNSSVGSFSVSTNSTSVILSFTPVSSNTTVKYVRVIA